MVELARVCGIMKIDAFCHRSLMCVVLFLSAGVLAKDGLPDTTKATVIDGLSVLGLKNDIATPECLFGTIVTNALYDATGTNQNFWTKNPYDERYRVFVELNQDGHDDLILSAPLSERGTGGLSYGVYLWTNGNYVCIGDISGHLSSLYVEHINEVARVIWIYSHSSCQSGAIGTFTVEGWRCVDNRYCHVELGAEGHDPPTVGSQLLDIIAKTATVPLRAEKSETKDGKVKWRPVDPRME